MLYQIFISKADSKGRLQSDYALIEETKHWIRNLDPKYEVSDIKRNRICKKLMLTIYYREKKIEESNQE